jgi:hypothetical protein
MSPIRPRCHDLFSHCEDCGKNGVYYYGDHIMDYLPKRTGAKMHRAMILEMVLEHIEDKYWDGGVFCELPFAREIGVWGTRVYGVLRWLEHLGIVVRRKLPGGGNTNYWQIAGDYVRE